MVVEWLKFRVSASSRDRFLQLDREIWTATLQQCDGFVQKAIWVSPEQPEALICVIHWASHTQWKAIPESLLIATETRFQRAMGDATYQLLEAYEFEALSETWLQESSPEPNNRYPTIDRD